MPIFPDMQGPRFPSPSLAAFAKDSGYWLQSVGERSALQLLLVGHIEGISHRVSPLCICLVTVAIEMFHISNFFGIPTLSSKKASSSQSHLLQSTAPVKAQCQDCGLCAWLHTHSNRPLCQKPSGSPSQNHLGSECHSLVTPRFLTDLLSFMGKGPSLLFAWERLFGCCWEMITRHAWKGGGGSSPT